MEILKELWYKNYAEGKKNWTYDPMCVHHDLLRVVGIKWFLYSFYIFLQFLNFIS